MTNTNTKKAPRAIYSSATDNWATPQSFFDQVNAEFGFTLDVCASTTNHKADSWYGLDHPNAARRGGLARNWVRDARGGGIWMNPPYGRPIGAWMEKAADTARAGGTVVCLVPARTDTKWFHDHVLGQAEVRYIRGRVKFGSATTGAPFASLLVIYRPLATSHQVAA